MESLPLQSSRQNPTSQDPFWSWMIMLTTDHRSSTMSENPMSQANVHDSTCDPLSLTHARASSLWRILSTILSWSKHGSHRWIKGSNLIVSQTPAPWSLPIESLFDTSAPAAARSLGSLVSRQGRSSWLFVIIHIPELSTHAHVCPNVPHCFIWTCARSDHTCAMCDQHNNPLSTCLLCIISSHNTLEKRTSQPHHDNLVHTTCE